MYQPSPTLVVDLSQVSSLSVDVPCISTAAWDMARLHVQSLDSRDLAEIERHLLTLDPLSRRTRFWVSLRRHVGCGLRSPDRLRSSAAGGCLRWMQWL
jgi:hypothetical protein